MRFINGLIGIVIGTFVLAKTYWLVQTFGKADWAERWFSGGFGGTYFLFKLIGLGVVLFSVLHLFGLLDNVVAPFTGLFGGLGNQ